MKKSEIMADQRLEIVVLEDDPNTLKMIEDELGRRGLIIHGFSQSASALQKMFEQTHIGVLLTDIEIRSPFPNGPRSDLQGYDVVNRLYERAPHRLFTVIVMTALDQESALDGANLFQVRPYFFSKHKWQHGHDEQRAAFDQLATLLTEAVAATPNQWFEQVLHDYPKSRWVCEKWQDGKRIPPLWEWYRKLWFSAAWPITEKQIGATADALVRTYKDGDVRKLRGDHLTLTATPNETSFIEYLIGRRVIFALAAVEPAYWEYYVRGEATKEEEPLLAADVWQHLDSEQAKNLINQIHRHAAENQLDKLHRDYTLTAEKVERLEEQQDGAESPEYQRLLHRQETLSAKLKECTQAITPLIQELAKRLNQESEGTRQAMIPFLRFWGADFSQEAWSKTDSKSSGGNDPLTQTLLLLGIRKQDIENPDARRWKHLLPEERKWLEKYLAEA